MANNWTELLKKADCKTQESYERLSKALDAWLTQHPQRTQKDVGLFVFEDVVYIHGPTLLPLCGHKKCGIVTRVDMT